MIFFCFLVGTKVGTVRGTHTDHTTSWVHSVGTVRGAHTGHTTTWVHSVGSVRVHMQAIHLTWCTTRVLKKRGLSRGNNCMTSSKIYVHRSFNDLDVAYTFNF